MTGPFGEDEFFEDEWVDVYDAEGHKASVRHLATVRLGGKSYMILGEIEEDFQEKGRLMLVREDRTVDGALEYVVVHDVSEIERVIGHFAMHLLMDHIDQLPEGIADELAMMDLDMPDFESDCGCRHRAGDFCFCGNPDYLQ
ncbi:MAG: hypothetical protein E7321_05040 [Clostridiales bacterium]|nr:hypothetical protein [Clostridiales bacterium]